ncbi:prepilin peptidase [Methylophaga sp.]|jgi:prepilin peptidase CpaA|uniref:prepilin peptidase n=1 Tax=Methylophaga sp. TaxID=2024840 RepID=UPI001400EA54|nr:prepilin peptidase [Methylophaga sp.]MTI63503.1 hypothetical protein [Methylophaga sp.]
MPDPGFTVVLPVVFSGWLMLCGYVDLRSRRLPNLLTLGAHLPAITALIIFHQSLMGEPLLSAVYAWLLALLLTLPAYAVRWLGAGDVKMLSALALMTGWQFLLLSFVIAGLLAGIIVLLWLLAQRSFPYLNLKLARWDSQIPPVAVLNGKALPFGGLLAVAGLTVLILQFSAVIR